MHLAVKYNLHFVIKSYRLVFKGTQATTPAREDIGDFYFWQEWENAREKKLSEDTSEFPHCSDYTFMFSVILYRPNVIVWQGSVVIGTRFME